MTQSKNLLKAERVDYILHKLQAMYPNPPIPLDHKDEYTLLIAVLLSAQCTDERVNQVTPASVVMSQAFGQPNFPVDTHIHRLAQRWGLSSGKSVAQTEKDLKRLFPTESWNDLHLQIIYYAREHCSARGCDGTKCLICTTCYPNRTKPKKTRKA